MKGIFFILLIMLFSCKEDARGIEVIEETSKDNPEEIVIEEIQVADKPTVKQILDSLKIQGFETFDYVDEKTKDTIIMQQYFMVFLKAGPIVNQNEEEASILQKEHRDYLDKMYELGYADISGPFVNENEIKGVTIYNVPTYKIADSLASADPMVEAGRLEIEIHPWWAAKGYGLR